MSVSTLMFVIKTGAPMKKEFCTTSPIKSRIRRNSGDIATTLSAPCDDGAFACWSELAESRRSEE